MKSTARTVAEYLDSLPDDRRTAIADVRRAVRRHLPKGYEEVMGWGGIAWQVPLARHAETYNGQPLCYAALASQKQYCTLYLMGCYAVPEQLARLRAAFAAAGQRMDMGKSCLRFTRSADLPLETIGALIAELPVDAWIEINERARTRPARRASPRPRALGPLDP